MTLQPAVRRDPWRFLWRLSSGDSLLAATMLVLSLFLAALAFFPQSPYALPPTDLWLAQTQSRFGATTAALYRLGLFSLAQSPLLTLLLAFTGFLLLTRAVDQVARLQQVWPQKGRPFWTCLSTLLTTFGALLLLLGLLIGKMGGWQVDGLVSPTGETLAVPGYGEIALKTTGHSVRSAQPGVTVHVTGSGPRLTLRALDETGRALKLQQAPREPVTDELTFILTADTPEAFFAVPEAGLVVRIMLAPGAALSADAPLRLQAFRSPSGDLVQERELTSEAELVLDGVQLAVTRSAYHVLSAVHNPGRWFTTSGIVIGAAGLLGVLTLTPHSSQRRRPVLAYRLLTSLLTVAVAGVTLQSLIVSGMIWNRSPLQAGLAALLLSALAAGLSTRR